MTYVLILLVSLTGWSSQSQFSGRLALTRKCNTSRTIHHSPTTFYALLLRSDQLHACLNLLAKKKKSKTALAGLVLVYCNQSNWSYAAEMFNQSPTT